MRAKGIRLPAPKQKGRLALSHRPLQTVDFPIALAYPRNHRRAAPMIVIAEPSSNSELGSGTVVVPPGLKSVKWLSPPPGASAGIVWPPPVKSPTNQT